MRVYAEPIGRPETISDQQLEQLVVRIRHEQSRRSEAEAWRITRAALRRWRPRRHPEKSPFSAAAN